MSKRWRNLIRAALGSFLLTSALAGQEPPDSPAPADTVIFETATVIGREPDSATAATAVVDERTLAALDALAAADALRFVPGVRVTTGDSRGALSAAQVRGGDPNFTLVLVDGVELNDPTDTEGGALGLSALEALDLERIEIVRGPLSATYGSSGLSGAIHLITRAPEQPEWWLDLGGGSFERRRVATGGVPRWGSGEGSASQGCASFGLVRAGVRPSGRRRLRAHRAALALDACSRRRTEAEDQWALQPLAGSRLPGRIRWSRARQR